MWYAVVAVLVVVPILAGLLVRMGRTRHARDRAVDGRPDAAREAARRAVTAMAKEQKKRRKPTIRGTGLGGDDTLAGDAAFGAGSDGAY